jgi:hypothetical protein
LEEAAKEKLRRAAKKAADEKKARDAMASKAKAQSDLVSKRKYLIQ